MGRIRLGFLRGREQPQPRTLAIICGLTRKQKKLKEPIHGTRPVIDMVLHHDQERHQVKALLDTGCSVALINEKTAKKLGLERLKHRKPHSIENYTGEAV